MQSRAAVREATREVLVFVLGNEEYGVDILKVQEIRGYEKVTPLPAAPAYLKGVVNLRGIIVPVIDLRVKFGMADPRYDSFTVVVILRLGRARHRHRGGRRIGRRAARRQRREARAAPRLGRRRRPSSPGSRRRTTA